MDPGAPAARAPVTAAVVLVARAAFAAAAQQETDALVARLAGRLGGVRVRAAYVEQGRPALRDVLRELRDAGCTDLRLVPLQLPLEPSYARWITRGVQRWQAAEPDGWPTVRIGPGLDRAGALDDLIVALAGDAADAAPIPASEPGRLEGSVVPAQKRRVLACDGAPCAAAGAAQVWSHLRQAQEIHALRTAGDGCLSTRTGCLGPCNLAPVLQVWPEGTYYGGVDEAAIDRIVASHLLGGRVVEALAYAPTGSKQVLRARPGA